MINFTPRRGAILMCDFGPEGWTAPRPTTQGPISVRPEVAKTRRCIVVSDEQYNHRHGGGAGLCIVVPCSATEPRILDATMVLLLMANYRAFTRDVWVKTTLVTSVSHARLERPRIGRDYVSDYVSRIDMALIEVALRSAQKI